MTYPAHWLLQFSGHQGELNEEFSCGIRMAVFGDAGPELDLVDEDAYIDDVAMPALTRWFMDPKSKVLVDAKITMVKFNKIGPQGQYVEQGVTHQQGTAIPGGVAHSAKCHPLQVAYCLSFRNNEVARGPASHGRIYVPRPQVTITVQGDVDGGDRVDMVESGVQLLNELDIGVGPPGATLRPAIVSSLGSGVTRQIDRVVVDSACDIQRRRAKSQSREVTSAPVNY